VVFNTHAIAGLQLGDVLLRDRAIAAVVHTHADAEALVVGATTRLDFVAHPRAADCAGYGRGRLPTAAADLVADEAAYHAANHGTSHIIGVAFAHDFYAVYRAVTITAVRTRVVRRRRRRIGFAGASAHQCECRHHRYRKS